MWTPRISMGRRVIRLLAVLAATLPLSWPALLNRYPLIYADTLEYVGDGPRLMQSLHSGGLSLYICKRSEFYTGSLIFLHRGGDLWPIVAVQALLTAWILWLVVRSFCGLRTEAVYLTLVAVLSLLTTIAWYVSFIMPDIFGGILYLSLYLLVFARKDLRPWELALVSAAAAFSATTHGSHLLLAAGECAFLSLLYLFRWRALRHRGRSLLWAIGVVVVAIAAQMAIHARMYGKPSIFGIHPPFLMARVISDGPAALYLHDHCPTLSWTICRSVDKLPAKADDFLWGTHSIWETSTRAQQQQLRNEEMPLVLATLRTYPRQQLAQSWENFLHQLTLLGPNDFWDEAIFFPAMLDLQSPGLNRGYRGSLQSRNAMPQLLFIPLQIPVLALSLLTIALLLPWAWRLHQHRLLGLAAIVLSVVPANAFVTGVLSGVFPRYQGRVAWLITLLAAVLLWRYWTFHNLSGARPLQPNAPTNG